MRVTENQLRNIVKQLMKEQAEDWGKPSFRDRREASKGPMTVSGDVGEWEIDDDDEEENYDDTKPTQAFGPGHCAECGVELIDGEEDTCEECKDVGNDWQPDPLTDDDDLDDGDPDSMEIDTFGSGSPRRGYGRYGTIADND